MIGYHTCTIGVTLPLFEHYADGADSECVIVVL